MAMIFTALMEKFAAFTVEQKKELISIKDMDMAALEAFCKTHGIDLAAEERGAMAEYFKTGKMPLADQELDNVAGGECGTITIDWPSIEGKCHFCGSIDHHWLDPKKRGLRDWRVCTKCGRHFHYF
jgi:hypothetical protein